MLLIFPWDKDVVGSIELILKVIGGAGAFWLFFEGLQRYKKDQIWRRNEFVAKEINEFTSDKMVRVVMSILDWGDRYVELFPDKPNYEERFVRVDRGILKLALQYHKYRAPDDEQIRFTRTEAAIRDYFDQFFSYFERFDQFVVSGMITTEELQPYLRYWINTIANGLKEDVRNFIYHYLNQYGYSGMQHLFSEFGKDIKPFTNIETTRVAPEGGGQKNG